MTRIHPSISLSLLLLISSTLLHAQNTPITERKKLSAADFKGSPDKASDHLATTFTNLSYQYSRPVPCTQKDKIRFTFVTSLRVGEKSWMKFDKIKSRQLLKELLEHEQGHYDIAEVLSLHLQKSFSAMCFDRINYAAQIDSIYKSVSKYYNTLQSRYDVETNHGQNEQQTRWRNRIEGLRKSIMSQPSTPG